MRTTISVSEAYTTLGLEHGADIDLVKTAYKEHARRTHPDKVLDETRKADATAEFQKIGEAYEVITKHLSRPAGDSGRSRGGMGGGMSMHSFGGGTFFYFGGGGGGGGRGGYYGDESEEDDDYLYDSEEDDDGHEEFFANLAFYMRMYERATRGRGGNGSGYRSRASYEQPSAHSEEVRRQQREQQEAAAARRAEEEQKTREQRERQRKAEAEAAKARRKVKAHSKKATVQAQRSGAAQVVEDALLRRQQARSVVFAAARKSNAAAVKKGVWEDNIDPIGGELLKGHEGPKLDRSVDPLETLLHIAVSQRDIDLVVWLLRHNADAEERDSKHENPFNRALAIGNVPIIKAFLEEFPPSSSESSPALQAHSTDSTLRLAVSSASPEVIRLVFNTGLVDLSDVNDAWKWIDEQDGATTMGSKWDGVREVLRMVDGWTPPATPSMSKDASIADEGDGEDGGEDQGNPASPPSSTNHNQHKANAAAKKRRQSNKKKQLPQTDSGHAATPSSTHNLVDHNQPSAASAGETAPYDPTLNAGRDASYRGRGGRGRGRGFRGRGGARDSPFQGSGPAAT